MQKIDATFIQQYKDKVILEIQSEGFLLSGTMQSEEKIEGSKAIWPKIGAGKARKKQRAQRAVPMNPDAGQTEALLETWEAFDYVYKYDLTRTNVKERDNLAKIGAQALGRASDEDIMGKLNAAAPTAGYRYVNGGANAFNAAYALTMVQKAQRAAKGVWRGDNFCPLPSLLWNQFLAAKQVSSSEYTGPDLPLAKMTSAKTWSGVHWFLAPDELFPVPSAGNVDIILYPRWAMGYCLNFQLQTMWDWENDLGAWSCRMEHEAAVAALQPDALVRGRFPNPDDGTIVFT
ncbi:phage capsid protein [Ancylobacter terrae]|uniref:phage capsid protein n=1 Tax=Ancylobacter sp. sgz301288 TaxID=3342077 RepID=UPI00385F22F1